MNVRYWQPQTVMKMQLVQTLMEVLSVLVLQGLVGMAETAIIMVCLYSCKIIDMFYHVQRFSEINECDNGDQDCQQLCINTVGSYKCACEHGYFLKSDGKTCLGT